MAIRKSTVASPISVPIAKTSAGTKASLITTAAAIPAMFFPNLINAIEPPIQTSAIGTAAAPIVSSVLSTQSGKDQSHALKTKPAAHEMRRGFVNNARRPGLTALQES